VLVSLGACSPARATKTKYGGIPSFLPTTSAPPHRVVEASVTEPHLAVQGDTVSVKLAHGHVLATVVGPKVPPFVSPPPEAVTATFTISLAQAVGTVPVAARDFTVSDQLGRLVHPQLVTGEVPLPHAVPASGHLTFELTAVLPTGEGVIHWSPGGSRTPPVSWDFIVEDD
jgi:hypothetical protein